MNVTAAAQRSATSSTRREITLGLHPFRSRCDLRIGGGARVGASTAFQPADRANGHVVIARNLARQADASESAGGQPVALGNGVSGRLAFDELDTARRASRIAAAGVQHVNRGILLDRQYEALPHRNIERSVSFDSQFRHRASIVACASLPTMANPIDTQVASTVDDYARLLTFAAHELRTPASVVGGYLRMLQLENDADFASRGRMLVDEAAKSCARLVELLAQMSDIGKLDLNAAAAHVERFDWFSELPAVAANTQEGRDRGIELSVTGEGQGAGLTGDRQRLTAGLGAILRAVLREQPMPVVVRADRRLVRENGQTTALLIIARAEDLERTLAAAKQPFDERRGGTGLSLPLARRAIERAGGHLWSPARTDSDQGLKSAVVIELPVSS